MRQIVFVALIGASLMALFEAAPAGAGVKKEQASLNFQRLRPALESLEQLPSLQPFEARDGSSLHYRRYPADSDTAFVLLHGSATDSTYLYPYAQALSEGGGAEVYTPDLRGHGPAPARRGDIDYIEQLEDDLADLITHIRTTRSDITKVVLGGHSSGGGLAVRFAGGRHQAIASGYVLLAPYLGHNAPTVRESSGGWANPKLLKIIPISLLNALGVTHFNDTQVLQFNLPAEYRTGTETLSYSYRLMTGIAPADYEKDLSAVEVPLLLLAGAEDEAMVAPAFAPTVRRLAPHAEVEIFENASHLDLVAEPRVFEATDNWLRDL